jgi:hypothetical protein
MLVTFNYGKSNLNKFNLFMLEILFYVSETLMEIITNLDSVVWLWKQYLGTYKVTLNYNLASIIY